jgi:26S proteasome regulatory subunit N10
MQQASAAAASSAETRPAGAASDVSPGTISAIQASDTMEDEEMKLAMSMSVEQSQPPASGSAGGDAGMAGLYDAGFLSTVLSSLPGVDTSDPRVQGVLEGIKKDEKKDTDKKEGQ